MKKSFLLALALLISITDLTAATFPTWMAGSWRSASDGSSSEEHWTDAEGNFMVGMHRDVTKKGRVMFEFLRIEEREGKLVYLAMPGGRSPATPFPLLSMEPSKIVFENPAHDFPQRITYWRDGSRLCARVDGLMNGKNAGEEWCWTRMK